MVVVVLVWLVVVSFQYDGLVFIVMVRHLFVFKLLEQTKYVQTKTKNQINGCQCVTELESKIFKLKK